MQNAMQTHIQLVYDANAQQTQTNTKQHHIMSWSGDMTLVFFYCLATVSGRTSHEIDV
jgi:hypothetical protein